MKRIAVVFTQFSAPSYLTDCALHIAKSHSASLVGLFLHTARPASLEACSWRNDMAATDKDFPSETDEAESLRLMQSYTDLFRHTCEAANVSIQVKTIGDAHLDALTDQTEFVDLLMMGAVSSPSQFSRKTFLSGTYCPVLLLPAAFQRMEQIIFTYDDTSPDLYAIKAFTYLFASLKTLPVHFVSVVATNILSIAYKEEITAWLEKQYANVTVEILQGSVKEVLPAYINNYPGALVVMGAYGRSSLSLLFKESLANVVLQQTAAAVFIAHN